MRNSVAVVNPWQVHPAQPADPGRWRGAGGLVQAVGEGVRLASISCASSRMATMSLPTPSTILARHALASKSSVSRATSPLSIGITSSPGKGPIQPGTPWSDGPTKATDLDRTEDNRELVESFVDKVLINAQTRQNRGLYRRQSLQPITTHAAVEGSRCYGRLSPQPAFGDGVFIAYDRMHRILADGDFVLTVSEGAADGVHTSFFDLFRVAQGKLVEHWDTTEPVPAAARADLSVVVDPRPSSAGRSIVRCIYEEANELTQSVFDPVLASAPLQRKRRRPGASPLTRANTGSAGGPPACFPRPSGTPPGRGGGGRQIPVVPPAFAGSTTGYGLNSLRERERGIPPIPEE